ncbi:hypothetical protein GCM10011507_18690 [Edaphobacter acidisoli]|uniref:Uncharacterized protein n=1 Tax=Edaphobacter acidisoli TaxID=2040573 RepID=A0A916W4N0_9BACT|nr:hypothetical protein GCM10011507_18690 [Edaphobacter acidisoli]
MKGFKATHMPGPQTAESSKKNWKWRLNHEDENETSSASWMALGACFDCNELGKFRKRPSDERANVR